MSWITEVGSVASKYVDYDLQKRKISSESNTTQPTHNTRALDSKIEAQTTANGIMSNDKMLYIGGGVVGLLVLVLVLKK